MSAVTALCTRGLYLENGQLKATGPIQEIADTYLRAVGKIAQLAPEARRFHLASFLMGRSSVEPACSSGLDCTGHERDFRVSAGGRQAHTLL